MAAKSTKKREAKVEFQGYLRVNLSTEQEAQFEHWAANCGITFEDFHELVENGYKFSLGWDRFNDCPVASLYSQNPKHEWAGWTLTAWAGSIDESMKYLFYKHYFICEEDWSTFRERPERSHGKRG